MGMPGRITIRLLVVLGFLATGFVDAQQQAQLAVPKSLTPSNYVLGPDDLITVRAMEVEEINNLPVRIDLEGAINLPLVGRMEAAGLTVAQLEAEVTRRLKTYVRQPDVVASVTEYRSQPVSVFGSVRNPGVHQLQGRKTLIEILSLAGGLNQDAGHTIKITRGIEWGAIPLPNAAPDATGRYIVAEVALTAIMEAQRPAENIEVRPHDVITVPRAEMVYVTGQVHKSGGFVLNERSSVTVLQALSLAGGLDTAAAGKYSRILRAGVGTADRTEIPVDLSRIMAGKARDVSLQPEDILFVPSSLPKKAAIKAIETAIQMGTGVLIWR
jgi:polysaccharide export outer membrane protein